MRVLTTGDGRFGGCMAALDVAPAAHDLDCRGRWVTFSCTGEHADGASARRMFASLRSAVTADKKVEMRVTDERKHDGFCHAIRIKIQDTPHVDEDSDGDGVTDLEDDVPLDASETVDSDDDGLGNHVDPDDDNDGVADLDDAFPFDPLETLDTDGDGLGDNADVDDDNDGVPDVEDAFPLDESEWSDTDGDGVGDNADPSSGSFPLLNGPSNGMAYADGRFYVIDAGEHRVFVYEADGSLDLDGGFSLDMPEVRRTDGSVTHTYRWHDVGGITAASNRLFVFATQQYCRRTSTHGRCSYTNHVRAYTLKGVRDGARDFDVASGAADWNGGIAHANGRFYLFHNYRDLAYAHSPTGERMPEFDFGIDTSSPRGSGGPGRIAFGSGAFYVGHRLFDEVRVYTGRGERQPSLDIQLDPCNTEPAGITVEGDVLHVADSGFLYDGRGCGEPTVYAYRIRSPKGAAPRVQRSPRPRNRGGLSGAPWFLSGAQQTAA